MRAAAAAALAACCLALAACGDDEAEPERGAPRDATTASPTTTGSADAAPERDVATVRTTPEGRCMIGGEFEIEVVSGDVPCQEAVTAVAGYDPAGPKVQEVGAFACEGGEAATLPVLITCVSPDGEVVARRPEG